jgi:hypothetical protein
MIFEREPELRDRIEALASRQLPGPIPIFEDATSSTAIHGGCVLRIGGNDYFIRGEAREGRFGIDDQPKIWTPPCMSMKAIASCLLDWLMASEGRRPGAIETTPAWSSKRTKGAAPLVSMPTKTKRSSAAEMPWSSTAIFATRSTIE